MSQRLVTSLGVCTLVLAFVVWCSLLYLTSSQPPPPVPSSLWDTLRESGQPWIIPGTNIYSVEPRVPTVGIVTYTPLNSDDELSLSESLRRCRLAYSEAYTTNNLKTLEGKFVPTHVLVLVKQRNTSRLLTLFCTAEDVLGSSKPITEVVSGSPILWFDADKNVESVIDQLLAESWVAPVARQPLGAQAPEAHD